MVDGIGRMHFSDRARRKADEDESGLAGRRTEAWMLLGCFSGIDAYLGRRGCGPQQGAAHAVIGAHFYDYRRRTVGKNLRTTLGASRNDAPNLDLEFH